MGLRKCCTVAFSAKVVMFGLSVIFWCASAGLMYLGVEMFHYVGNIHSLASNYFLTIPASVSIGLSLLFLMVGIVGLVAVTRDDAKCLRRTFFALLLVIFVLELLGACLAIVNKEEISGGIEKGLNNTMTQYDHSENFQKSMDYVQSHLECCGSYKADDWLVTPWGLAHPQMVPLSCCKENATNCTGSITDDMYNIYHDGCHEKLYEDLREYLVYIIVIAVLLFLLEILALVCTCYLTCCRDYKHYQQIQTDSSYNYQA